MRFKRVFVIVLDSLGIGPMADSARFDDAGADTLGHISETVEHLDIPNLQRLGLANLKALKQVKPAEHPEGYFMAMNEASNGKDTMTGHWEMMGIRTDKPFITFTEHGFPKELIDELEKRCGRKIIGNKAASGTEILEELGEQEVNEGKLIVYTSADSVLQICGNDNILIMEEKQTIAACGAGTTTKVYFPAENRIERAENVKEVEQYIDRIDEMIGRKEKLLGRRE